MVIIHPLDRQGNTVAASAHKIVREGRGQVRPHENAPVSARAIPAFACVQRTLMLFAYQRCDPRVGGHETIGRRVRASKYLASSHRCSFPPSGCPSRAPYGGRIPALQLQDSVGGHLHPLMSLLSFVSLGKIPDPGAPHRSGRPIQGGQRAGAPPGLERHPERKVPKRQHGRAPPCAQPSQARGSRRRLRRRPPRRRAAAASLSAGWPRHPPRAGR